MVAQFLKGQAYCYYANTLAKDYERWDLCSILVKLFNYCFPIDFCMQMHQKLEESFQGEKTICNYAQELEMTMDMVGVDNLGEHLQHLWDSLTFSIQQALWDHKMFPFHISQDDVVKEAEFIKASRNIGRSNNNNTKNLTSFNTKQSKDKKSSPNPKKSAGGNNNKKASGKLSAGQAGKPPLFPKGGSFKISDEKKAELKAAGKCFCCESTEHFSRNCPKNNTVSSGGHDHPPGIPSLQHGT